MMSRSPRTKRGGNQSLVVLAQAAAAIVHDAPADEQAAREVDVCLAVARQLHPQLDDAVWSWITTHGFPLPDGVDDARLAGAAADVLSHPSSVVDPLAEFYEHFLHAFRPNARRRRGVFYTPLPLVRFILQSVDRSLRDEFSLSAGLLDETTWGDAVARGLAPAIPAGLSHESPLVTVLDPALGAGLFLTELIRLARASVTDLDQWNALVPRLLARLGGIEILPAAAAIAVVRIAATLAVSGYRFESHASLALTIGDALQQPIRPPWTVIVGNPPFSGISTAKHAWLGRLLHGVGPESEPRADYFDVDGRPLGERKHWLQDDYVKFLRIAHEQIETTGLGIVALVTNHGYLDNVSFRGLRQKLWQTFPRLSLVDLHGNAKRRERTPDDERDENVFGIEQGVAIGVMRRPPPPCEPIIERADVWGTREAKLAALELPVKFTITAAYVAGQTFRPTAPLHREYDDAWPLDEAMPVNTTAPVTARDHFVVAHTVEELAARCRDFCDPSLTDDQIRERYFTRTRSPQYLPGDTRGWRLADARRRMQAEGWQSLVERVLYRPFDWRAMLWAPWMIDWPRTEVMAHLLAGNNLALITRRQAPPGQPWTFAWVTDGLTLDGVIRSDNRGSESLFPLWLGQGDWRTPNFAPAFQAAFANLDAKPQDIFDYVYALLHAGPYRQRYAAQLAAGFPRVLVPKSRTLFRQMAGISARLIDAHLLRCKVRPPTYVGRLPTEVAAGFPRHRQRRLYLNADDYFDGVSARAWAAFAGSHQVARKLFKDRRGRVLAASEIEQLGKILGSLRRSVALQQTLDRGLLANVDFATAFGP